SGEPELTAWVLPKTSLNATVPFLLFSYWQAYCHSCVGGRFSVPDIPGVNHKQKHRQDRERVFYMNEITIAVKYDNDNPTVSGRELHAALEVRTQYSIWFDRMCEYGFSEGIDYYSFFE
ncbi:MAG TPA: antA/AntB antirepressor family protein, partial [Ruminococcus flavefaciens]|nr:antA/AntB antirepressor family protein [Ruminococcus flavefaciens]